MPGVARQGDEARSASVWTDNPAPPPSTILVPAAVGTFATGLSVKTFVNSKPIALTEAGGVYLPASSAGNTFKATEHSSWKVEGKHAVMKGNACRFDSAVSQVPGEEGGTGSVTTGSPDTFVD